MNSFAGMNLRTQRSKAIMPKLNRKVLAVELVGTAFVTAGLFGLHQLQVGQQGSFYLEQAEQSLQGGDAASAVGYFQKALQMDPQNFETLCGLSSALEQVGNTSAAYLTAQRAERFRPKDRDNNLRLAKLSLEMRRYSDSIDRVQALLPGSAGDEELVLYELLGDAQARNMNSDQAVVAYQKALALDGVTPEIYGKLARLQTTKYDSAETAQATLDSMVERFADDPDALITRGQWYLEQVRGQSPSMSIDESGQLGRYLSQANRDAEAALELDSNSVDALLFATQAALRSEQYERVSLLADRGMAAFEDEASFYTQASMAAMALSQQASDESEQEHQKIKAEKVLESGIARLPSNTVLLWALATRRLESGRVNSVKPLVERLRQLNFVPPLVRFLDAQLLAADGQNLAASRILELVRADLVELPEIVRVVDLALADVYHDTGDIDRQIAVLQRVVSANSSWLPGRERLAIALLQGGRVDEAVQEYRSVASRPGIAVTAPLNFARLLILQNLNREPALQDWSQVRSLLELLGKEDAMVGEVAILKAEMMSAQNQIEEARRILAEAVNRLGSVGGSPPTGAAASVWSARVLLEVSQGDAAAARKLLADADSALGSTPEVRYTEAVVLVTEAADEMHLRLEAVAAVSPQWSDEQALNFRRRLIPLLISAQSYDLARRVAGRVMEQRPSDVMVRLQMLEIASRSGQFGQMEEVLDELLAIAGKTARWYYGTALFISRRTDVDPSSSDSTLLSNDMNRRAQEYLAEAAVLRPDWSAVPALSGQLYDRAGDEESAIIKYSQAVDLGMRQPAMIRRLVGLLTTRERFGEADSIIGRLRSGNQPFSSDMARIASEVSVQMADLQRAARLAKEAAKDSGVAADWLWLANLSEMNDDSATAESAYRQAVELDPTAVASQLRWVGFLDRNARLGEAKQALHDFAESIPVDDRDSLLAVAEGYARLGEASAAAAQLDKVDAEMLATVTQHDTYYRLLRQLRDEGMAASFLAELVDRPGEIGAWARRERAMQFAGEGQASSTEQAKKLLKRNLASWFSLDTSSSVDAGMLYASADRATFADRRVLAMVNAMAAGTVEPKRALGLFQQLQQDGWSPSVTDEFVIGQLYISDGDWSQGRKRMLPLLSNTELRRPEYVRTYASLLIERGDAGEAQLWLDQLRAAGDQSIETARLVASSMFQRRQYDALLAALSMLPSEADSVTDPLARWFSLSASTRQRFEMLGDLTTQLLVSQGGEPDVATPQSVIDQFQQASARMKAALQEADDFPGVYYAMQLLERGQCSEAVRALTTAAENASEEELIAFAESAIVNADCGSSSLQSLERLYGDVAVNRTRKAVFAIILARLKETRGDYDEAIVVYERVLQLDPSNVVAMNNLATLLALTRKDPQRGIDLCNAAIASVGEAAYLLDTRGVCHLAAGHQEQSQEDFLSAVEKLNHPVLRFHVALSAMMRKDEASAKQQLNLALRAGLTKKMVHPLEVESLQRLMEL